MINRKKLQEQLLLEREVYLTSHQNSYQNKSKRSEVLLYNAPMNWMQQWPLAYPITIESGCQHKVTDIDSNEYIDFCLGYSAAFPGHGSKDVSKLLHEQMNKGMVYTMPSSLDAKVAGLLKERFGQDFWGFALSATDANRFMIKLCRAITNRKKILVFNGCYHGTVEEAFAMGENGETKTREGNIGIGVETSRTTAAIEFNNRAALEQELEKGIYACLLLEPVMTNCGIIHPMEGYLEQAKELCKKNGTVFIIDEAHTITTDYAGYAKKHNLEPDALILGKCIGGGFPAGAYGVSESIKNKIDEIIRVEYSDTSGIGGTMTGSIMAMSGIKAALTYELTKENFIRANANTDIIVKGMGEIIEKNRLEWSIARLGARFDIWFAKTPGKDASEAFSQHDEVLYEYLFTALVNKGYIMSPYWNLLGSVSPYLSEVECHQYLLDFEEAVMKIID
ncbi:transaminase [Sinanaerobacter chloroacetimidivorans]|jgi:glutamate-1-semialdehyde 2,1-aminomutase|uniref:Aminotransferase class III-fold pyridoxal phosphate-dependent enzyme n=1 Tax=Sinanaerobacter chloroacetimidivorans TaxID=2818044 RepID=A0A8J7W4L0_9FIRM|nr:transaminase [Sinanaerobacter chloroacetimidivorans]MBR0600231.1 aminotransferase class III-fold pyridoxal phosphate-dependent enzyme [Sinanaerobacter chloroacetimidivorans]